MITIWLAKKQKLELYVLKTGLSTYAATIVSN